MSDAHHRETAPAAAGTDTLDSTERRQRILTQVRTRDFVRIQDLSRQLGVSEVTIRADVDRLARDGGLRRVRGGVMRVLQTVPELRYEARSESRLAEKKAIAAAAVAMLSDGDSVILDAGTTTMEIAHAIADRAELSDLTVFTAGLNVALALERAIPRIQVIVTGGALRPQQHSLVEPLSTLVLERIRAAIGFVGCNGIDPALGIMCMSLPDAGLKQAIIAASHRTVVVADASKFSQTSLVRFCPFDAVDMLLTAGTPDPAAAALVTEAGVEVRVADAVG
jgi:DeoR family transcriptional regulator of aga operon